MQLAQMPPEFDLSTRSQDGYKLPTTEAKACDPQLHPQASLALVRPDCKGDRQFLLTFDTVAIKSLLAAVVALHMAMLGTGRQINFKASEPGCTESQTRSQMTHIHHRSCTPRTPQDLLMFVVPPQHSLEGG